jgi:hypothetical protein
VSDSFTYQLNGSSGGTDTLVVTDNAVFAIGGADDSTMGTAVSDTFTYQLTGSNGGIDEIVVTADSTLSSIAGAGGQGYAVTAISGSIDGVAITGEVGPSGQAFESSDGDWLADNAVFAAGGIGGSVVGVDYYGLLFEAGGIEYNLYSLDGSMVLGSSDNGTYLATAAPITVVSSDAPCFCHGTRILTTWGEVAVEDLRPGDLVVTRFGPLRAVKWIGRHTYNGLFVERHRAPVRIRAGALGDNVPCCDLSVSPDHRMVIDDLLVQARHLVNGVTVTQEPVRETISYCHIDFGVHDCVIADGAWSESYAEQNNRGAFHNEAEFAAEFPNHAPVYQTECLPLAEKTPDRFKAIQLKILQLVPGATLTADAGLYLLADGKRIEPATAGKTSVFRIPAGTRSLRIMSNASKPVTVGINQDFRLLGLRLEGLTARHKAVVINLRLDADLLTDGWHGVERDKDGRPFRWTSGDAALPASLIASQTEDVEVELKWGCLARYFLAPRAAGECASSAGALSVAA